MLKTIEVDGVSIVWFACGLVVYFAIVGKQIAHAISSHPQVRPISKNKQKQITPKGLSVFGARGRT